MKHILEIEFKWGDRTRAVSWGVETGSFLCEELLCETCEFRFLCFTTAEVEIELEREFPDSHTAMKYRSMLRKRFPRSRIND